MVPNFLDGSDRKGSAKVVLFHVENNDTKDNDNSSVIMHNVCCCLSLQTRL